jgi:delta 1-pyrroline-5-carboxylate dehydrogenase
LEFADKTDKGFMLCVQWHPERIREKENNPLSENLKKEFMEAVKKTSNKKLVVTNPANEEIIAALNQDTRESLVQKLALLHSSQPTWYFMPLAERIQIIKKFSICSKKILNNLLVCFQPKSVSLCNNHVMK